MWLSNQTRAFDYTLIPRFDLLVAIAKVMRGNHFFYVCPERKAIYGIPEEPFAIREVMLPDELVPASPFIFRLDTLDASIIAEHVNFAMFKDMPWALVPASRIDEAINYVPLYRPLSDTHLWILVDKFSNHEVDFIDLYGPDSKKSAGLHKAMRAVNAFFNGKSLLSSQTYVFPNMERNITIRDIFSSKAVNGETYIQLQYDNKRFGMFLFKNLFVFNKNDGLTITIRERADNNKAFEAMFRVVHDKNPIKYIINGSVIENTYGMFLNVI